MSWYAEEDTVFTVLSMRYTANFCEGNMLGKTMSINHLIDKKESDISQKKLVNDKLFQLDAIHMGKNSRMELSSNDNLILCSVEGKCALFKTFADVDAFPLCVRSKDVDDIVKTVSLLAGSFGGVNLEDISAPRCFEIERRLKECCDIPIFHDDQHGTAVVTAAALINALKLVGKKLDDIKVVTSGAGAAGIAIIKLLVSLGLKNVVMCDRHGAIYKGRDNLNKEKEEMAEICNQNMEKGTLAEVLKGADVFIGVSAPGTVTEEMVQSMADKPILFPMANPVPEIMPDLAKKAGAAVVGTGRSDFPNQINNVLAFPGIFRGALDVRAKDINDEMKVAAAYAIASLVDEDKLSPDYIIPNAFDKRVSKAVAEAVAEAARKTGVARI